MHMSKYSGARRAFTLIELLVVIAIIAILTAILFPVFARARENARRSSCASNMKQMGIALASYTQDYDEHFPLRRVFPSGAPPTGPNKYSTSDPQATSWWDYDDGSWRSQIQPYIKSTQVLQCPSNAQNKLPTYDPEINRSYGANWAQPSAAPASGPPQRGPFNDVAQGNGVHLSDIPSPSQLISVVEMWNVPWVAVNIDRTLSYDDTGTIYNGGMTGSGYVGTNAYSECIFTGHNGRSNYLFADGHVKALRPLQTISGTNMWYRVDLPPTAQAQTNLERAEALAG